MTDSTHGSVVVDALVVGAGFSGLQAVHRLRGDGFSVRGVETAPDVGGTWYWNRYPGARCDVESVDYSIYWDPELDQEWEWSEKYPAQKDLHAYLRRIADKHDLRRDFDFETTITEAVWHEDESVWVSKTADGREYRSQFLIMAVGCLSVPKDIDVPGMDDFGGEVLRTWNWPDDADLTGQRVGVIGTGSTGAQVIPALAQIVEQLTVLQRTPNFVIPTRNRPLEPGELDEIKAEYPARRERNRTALAGVFRDDSPYNAFDVDDETRRAHYEERWERGGLNFLGAFQDLMFDKAANDSVAEFIHTKIDEIVPHGPTADALKPRSYPMGAKRPVIATDYYETFARDNVTLVDVRADPIDAFTADGVRLASGAEHEFDTLVLAIGFDAFTGPYTKIDIRGVGGKRLADSWSTQGPKTHLGMVTAGFPNMLVVAGAGSPSVLANMVTAINDHIIWIGDLLNHMRAEGLASIDTTEEAQDAWVQVVEDVANMTLWPTGESGSWYRGENVVGKPQIFMPFAGGVVAFREHLEKSRENDYAGFVLA